MEKQSFENMQKPDYQFLEIGSTMSILLRRVTYRRELEGTSFIRILVFGSCGASPWSWVK